MPLKELNLGIGEDQAENVLWWAKNLVIPPLLKNAVELCGTNNLSTDSVMDIADCIANIGSCLHENPAVSLFLFVGWSWEMRADS